MKTLFNLTSVGVVLFLSGAIAGQAQTLVVKKQIVNKLLAMGRLTQADVKECGGAAKVISVVQNIDLNKDGKPEFIATFSCAGINFGVFRKTAEDVQEIFEGYQNQDIKPMKTYTNGWRNLRLFEWSAGPSGGSGSEILRWNGICYQNASNPCPK